MKNYIVRCIKSKHKDKYTYEYYDKHNKKIVPSKKLLSHIYIPPAYDDVKINMNINDKVLAIGYDTKDRPQYIYNKKFTASQTKKKYKKLIDFGDNYKQILQRVNRDLSLDDDSKDKQIALVLKLVIECNFRIGNDKYSKENKSFGVTTLESRHIKQKGNVIIVDFIGKKGVHNKCSVKNKHVSRTLRKRKKTLKKNERVFEYVNNDNIYTIKSSDVNDYLKQFGDFSAKNFRTWNANLALIRELIRHDKSELISKREKNLKLSIDVVSQQLHHTPSICKKDYINPKLIDMYIKDSRRFNSLFKKNDTIDHISEEFTNFLYVEYT